MLRSEYIAHKFLTPKREHARRIMQRQQPFAFRLGALLALDANPGKVWRQLQPLISPFTPSAKGGSRKLGVSNKAALSGILFVLHTGIP